jgi:Uma2 family endonuclease
MRQPGPIADSYLPEFPAISVDLPVLYENEGQEHVGETAAHTHAAHTAFAGLLAHFADKSEYRVFANLSLYYHPTNRAAYVSPDIMVVCPSRPLDADIASYRVGHDGPAPLLVVEVLGRRSAQQHDLTLKPIVYAQLGVKELLYVDTTGKILPERVQLRRLQLRDESWNEIPQGENGQIVSAFGFSVVVEPDQKVRLGNPQLKQVYPRLEETHNVITAWSVAMETLAQAKQARKQALEQLRQVKAQLRAAESRLAAEPPEARPIE